MKRIKIMGLALVAIMAIGVVLAGSASASTKITMKDPLGGLASGATIAAHSTNLVTVTTAGTLECENSLITGTLSTSGVNESTIKANSSSDEENGTFLGIPGACKTSIGAPVEIVTSKFPWLLEFKASGSAGTNEVKSEVSKGKVTFTSEFLVPELGEKNKCEFEAGKIISSFNAGSPGSPVPLEFTTTNQLFKLNKTYPNTAAICPKEGHLSGTWTVSDSNGGITVE